MSKRNVGIDRLEIRLKGVAPESVRAAVGDLGRAVLGQLARQRTQGRERNGNIERLDSGTVRLTSGATPSELRKTIADRIVGSINSTPRNR